ncbi:MAG: hypothetical protein ACRDP5_28720 [Streptosporangiaceae bacterium]
MNLVRDSPIPPRMNAHCLVIAAAVLTTLVTAALATARRPDAAAELRAAEAA